MIGRRGLLGGAALLAARPARAQNLRGDEALEKVLLDGEGWQQVSGGHGFCDGACPDGEGGLLFGDLHEGGIHRVDAGGTSAPWWPAAPRVSGMKLAPDGRLIAAVQGPRKQVVAIDRGTKKVAALATGTPNDLVVTRKGHVFFTDTARGTVVGLAPGGKPRVVASGLRGPNGVTLSPDHGTLIVSEHAGANAWAYRVEPDGTLAFGAPWIELRTPVGREQAGGDGATTDAEGRFYVTSYVGVQMFDWTGRMGGVIAPPPGPTPVSAAFAGPDGAYLHVCAGDKVWRRKTKTKGA